MGLTKTELTSGFIQGRDWRKVSSAILVHPVIPFVVAAAILRAFLMPTTMHNDTVWMPWMAFQIDLGHWNVYQYLYDSYGQRTLTPVVWAPYLPLYYYITAGWTGLLKILGVVDVGEWWFDSQRWYIPNLSLSIFFMKALYIPFDVAIAWALSRLVSPERRVVAVALWCLCPVVLVSTYMMGQNDIIATAPVVLATLAGEQARCDGGSRQRSRERLFAISALLLGLGAACKSFPLLLVIPFALVIGNDVREIIRYIVLGFAPYVGVLAPFVGSQPFRAGVLFNPEAQHIFASVPGIGPLGTSPFIAAYTGLVFVLLVHRQQPFKMTFDLPTVGLMVIGLIFATSSWPFYWLVWLMPFAVWSASQNSATYAQMFAYCAVFLVWTWNWGTKTSAGLFAPLLPFASSVPAVSTLVNAYFPWDHLMVVVQSVLFGIYVVHLFILLRATNAERTKPLPLLAQCVGVQSLLFVWIGVSFLPMILHR